MECVGEEWNEIESKLSNEIQESMAKRHYRIRSSAQFFAVVEMILAGQTAKTIGSFLRKKDPHLFGSELISNNALLQQIIRFKEEVTARLREESGEFHTTIDMFTRVSGKHFDPIAMIRKVILIQELRLSDALENEMKMMKAIQKLPPEKQLAKLSKIYRITGREMERLCRSTMCYLLYDLMSQPCTVDQKEFVHGILRIYRNYLPSSRHQAHHSTLPKQQ